MPHLRSASSRIIFETNGRTPSIDPVLASPHSENRPPTTGLPVALEAVGSSGGGQWAVGSGQWAVGSGQQRRWAVGSSPGGGGQQRRIKGGQWKVNERQWKVNKRQWKVNEGQ